MVGGVVGSAQAKANWAAELVAEVEAEEKGLPFSWSCVRDQ